MQELLSSDFCTHLFIHVPKKKPKPTKKPKSIATRMPLTFEEIIFTMNRGSVNLVVVKNSSNIFRDKEQPLNVNYKKKKYPFKG